MLFFSSFLMARIFEWVNLINVPFKSMVFIKDSRWEELICYIYDTILNIVFDRKIKFNDRKYFKLDRLENICEISVQLFCFNRLRKLVLYSWFRYTYYSFWLCDMKFVKCYIIIIINCFWSFICRCNEFLSKNWAFFHWIFTEF